jgi:hypothetical protein
MDEILPPNLSGFANAHGSACQRGGLIHRRAKFVAQLLASDSADALTLSAGQKECGAQRLWQASLEEAVIGGSRSWRVRTDSPHRMLMRVFGDDKGGGVAQWASACPTC